MKKMIKLTNVSKRFKKKILFEDFSLEINTTGLYGIVGQNGSGKTTLLKMMNLKEKTTQGTITNDYSTVYVDVKNLVFTRLNVWENLKIICDDDEKIESVIEEFYLAELKTQSAKSLSMGEKVRLAIARAILLNSQVILLDEPTANLDEKNRCVLLEILKKISKERIIIFTTNQEPDLENCDAVLCIRNAKVETNFFSKNSENMEYETKSYTNEKLLKKALGGYGYIYRILCILFIFFFSVFLSVICIKEEDIIYNTYNFSKEHSYMLMEEDYFEKSAYDIIDKSMYNTQAVQSLDFSFFLDKEKINLRNISSLKDFEILKRIPETIFVHYESQKYDLADDEIIMTEDLYTLFTTFSQIEKSTFTMGDLSLKVKRIEPKSSLSNVEILMQKNEEKVFQYIDETLREPEFDFDKFLTRIQFLLYEGCSNLQTRAKDIENAHIYLNRNTYEAIYRMKIESLPILEKENLKSFKITPNYNIDENAKYIIVSTSFWSSYIKGFRIKDILNGSAIPLYYDISGLKLYYQVAGVVESEKKFITFLDEDYTSKIIKDSIQKDFDEIYVSKEESRSVFDSTKSNRLVLVMQNYHTINDRLENVHFLFPFLRPFVIVLGVLMGMTLIIFSLIPLLRKRKTILLLANSNRTLLLKKQFVFKISYMTFLFLSIGIVLSIIFTPVVAMMICDIWSFDFVSWISIFSLYFVGYLWIEGVQKILIFRWIK